MIDVTRPVALLLAVLALSASPALAESRLGGAGAQSCRSLTTLAASKAAAGRSQVQWALGYLTGRIEAAPTAPHRPFTGPDGIAADLIAYCGRHRDAQVADAAAWFFEAPAAD